ncbi:MAG: hypothetical protein WCF36_07180 [Candidatus Nanopelagicales bacterium]
MGPNLTPQSRRLLRSQRGVIASWQAREVGLSVRQLNRARLTTWQQVTARTFVAGELEVTAAQLRVAGVLEGGPQAALTGTSALVESGWTGDSAGCVDIVVARGQRSRQVPAPPWLRVHVTVDVPPRSGRPSRVTAARAVVDSAAWARTPRERLFLLTSAVQQRLTNPDQIRRQLLSRGRVPFAREIRDVLDEIEGGVTSTAEADFRRACRARGLPTPRMQVRRFVGGRVRRTDAEFTLPDGRLLIVEIDGVGHLGVAQWHADLARQNALVVKSGALVMRVSNWELRHDPEPFFAQIIGLFNSLLCTESTT